MIYARMGRREFITIEQICDQCVQMCKMEPNSSEVSWMFEWRLGLVARLVGVASWCLVGALEWWRGRDDGMREERRDVRREA